MSQANKKAAAVPPQGPGSGTKVARQQLTPTREAPNNTAVQVLNKFGLAMFQQVAANLTQNVLLSPAAVASSLLTAHACANGDTMNELGAMIGSAAGKQEALKDALHALFDIIDRDMARTDNVLVSKLFVSRHLEINEDCRALVASQMRCDVDRVAFHASSPEEVADVVNASFDNCSPLIGQVLAPETVDPAAKIVLASAFYYRGLAEPRFERCAEPRSFTPNLSTKLELDYVCNTGPFLYAEIEEPVAAKALELFYHDSSLLLLMPERAARIKDLRTHVTPALLSSLAGQLKPKTVRVELPFTRIESRYTLNTTLFKAGVKTAFMSDAEFTNLVPLGEARLNDVLHKAALVIDEGLQAATIPTPQKGAPPPPQPTSASKPFDVEFALTKPFVFVLRRFSDGRIMLAGVVHELKKQK